VDILDDMGVRKLSAKVFFFLSDGINFYIVTNISVSNKHCYFEPSIHQIILKECITEYIKTPNIRMISDGFIIMLFFKE